MACNAPPTLRRPTGGYLQAATASSASWREQHMGKMTPYAPASSARFTFSRLLAENQIHGDHLVRAARRQAVRAGQIDEIEAPAGVGQAAFLGLDRDTGIIADPLPHAGEGVEQGRLAGVRIAEKGNRHGAKLALLFSAHGRSLGRGVTSTRAASARRRLRR